MKMQKVELIFDEYIMQTLNTDDSLGVFQFNSSLKNLTYIPRKPFKTLSEGVEKTESFISQMISGSALWLSIRNKMDSEFVGYCGLFGIDEGSCKSEIGYGILEKYWGNGITTNAISELVNFGFDKLNLHKIYAKIDPNNLGSKKVVKKVGFVQEGCLRDDEFARGQYFDMEYHSIFRENPHP
jgi:ribosomal-protein-alanine N-acetyltransferase